MKTSYTIPCAAIAAIGLAAATQAGVVNFTAAEGYTDGAMLNTHPDWDGQNPWVIDQSGGNSDARDTGGAFVRARFQGETSDNTLGSSYTVGATFNFVNNFSDPGSLGDFDELAFLVGATEQAVAAPDIRIGAALAVNDDVGGGSSASELELRWVGVGAGTVNLGLASLYDGHDFSLRLSFNRINATQYNLFASVDSLNDAAGAFIQSTIVTPDASFSGAGTVFGVFEAVTASAAAFGGTEVDQFSFGPSVPEPSTLALLGMGFLALGRAIRRRTRA